MEAELQAEADAAQEAGLPPKDADVAAALAELARDNLETQGAVARAGGISPLLALLSSRSGAAQAPHVGAGRSRPSR